MNENTLIDCTYIPLIHSLYLFYAPSLYTYHRVGVYFVFSYAIHNYRVKLAWDERELEFKQLKQELSQVKDSITTDDVWLANTIAKIKAAKSTTQTNVLKEEIQTKVDGITLESKTITTTTVSGKATAKGDNSEHMVGSLISGLGGGRLI